MKQITWTLETWQARGASTHKARSIYATRESAIKAYKALGLSASVYIACVYPVTTWKDSPMDRTHKKVGQIICYKEYR